MRSSVFFSKSIMASTARTAALVSRRWLLASRPVGIPDASTFRLTTAEVSTPQSQQIVVKTREFSLDPAMRVWISEKPSYREPIEIGSVMNGSTTGVVVESKSSHFEVGDVVVGGWGWQEYAVLHERDARKLPKDIPSAAFLGAFGFTGLTAISGVNEILRPQPGETALVSGAAGATGSIAVQLLKAKGTRVVAIAGSEDKVAWLKSIGCDAAVNYKNKTYAQLAAAIKEACPKGIDVYFDNVGGDQLEIALDLMNIKGRVACCGMISGYNDVKPTPGPSNLATLIFKRIRMEGFLVMDFAEQFPQMRQELLTLYRNGKLSYKETVVEGFESLPSTFVKLFDGSNTGKLIVRARL